MSCCQDGCCAKGQEKQEVLVEVSVVQYYPNGGVSTICHFGNVPLGSVRIDGRTIQFECQHKILVFILADSVQVEITEQEPTN